MESALRRLSVFLAAISALAATGARAGPAQHPLLTNDTGKTVLRKFARGNDISMLVISRAGTSVLFDPRAPGAPADLIAITHDHEVEEVECSAARGSYLDTIRHSPKVVWRPGRFAVADVVLTGIPASQFGGPVATPPDYIVYLLEVDGIRVAYFPCLSQKQFTADQLAALGTVDVVMTSAEDKGMSDRRTRDFFRLARQLRPRLIVPLTHNESDLDWSIEQVGGHLEVVLDTLALDRRDLHDQPERIVKLVSSYTE